VAVHERKPTDRYATRKLHDLLADCRWPRRSDQWERQTTVTAQLNELHPKKLPVLKWRQPRRIDIRGRVA
jgi:hypothetical protein